MDRRPLIDKSMTVGKNPVAADDMNAGPSPMCGPAALTKLLNRKKETTTGGAHVRSSPIYEPPKNGLVGSASLSLFGSRSSYEEMNDQEQYQHSSDDKDTESTSGSDKSGEMLYSPVRQFPQFYPPNGDASAADTQKMSSPRTPNRPRISSWSSTLAAVTEETSFDDISKDASAEQPPHTINTEPSKNDQNQQGQEEQMQEHYEEQKQGQPMDTPKLATSPEKKEMLKAMRSLILKQQEALKEMSEQNSHYRKKVGEYQSKLIEMKQESVDQQACINQLALEKEASAAECLWLREELRAVQQKEKAASNLCLPCLSENGYGAVDDVRDDEDDSLRDKFTDLMNPHIECPSSICRITGLDRSTSNEVNMWEYSIQKAANTLRKPMRDAHQYPLSDLDDSPASAEPVSIAELNSVANRKPESNAQTMALYDTDKLAWIAPQAQVYAGGGVAALRQPSSNAKSPTPMNLDKDHSHMCEDSIPAPDHASNERGLTDSRDDAAESALVQANHEFEPFRDSTAGNTNTWKALSTEAACVSKGSIASSSSWSGISGRSREEARKEMAQYKQRLECLQKRRSERRSELQQCNKPAVRFGLLTDI